MSELKPSLRAGFIYGQNNEGKDELSDTAVLLGEFDELDEAGKQKHVLRWQA